MTDPRALERRIRTWLAVFILGLVLSGTTAFPLETEVRCLHQWLTGPGATLGQRWPGLVAWVARVTEALTETSERHPFLSYGTDWLAFAHLVIAMAFWGPFKDPIRNVWVVEWGMLACLAVLPLALVCGRVRGIPMFWQAIDISFGVFGLVPLLLVRRDIRRLDAVRRPNLGSDPQAADRWKAAPTRMAAAAATTARPRTIA